MGTGWRLCPWNRKNITSHLGKSAIGKLHIHQFLVEREEAVPDAQVAARGMDGKNATCRNIREGWPKEKYSLSRVYEKETNTELALLRKTV